MDRDQQPRARGPDSFPVAAGIQRRALLRIGCPLSPTPDMRIADLVRAIEDIPGRAWSLLAPAADVNTGEMRVMELCLLRGGWRVIFRRRGMGGLPYL